MSDQRTALHSRHEALGAHFVPYGEWRIPDYYESIEAEYEAMRNTASLIDCCHDGRLRVSGDSTIPFLNMMTTMDVSQIPVNALRDTLILNDRGGIVDTVVLFRADKFCTVHCSGLVRRRLMQWFDQNKADFPDIAVADNTTAQGCVELRGPMARSILESTLLDGTIPKDINSSVIVQIGQARCLVTFRRTMGMDVFRIETGGLFVEAVWDRLMTMGEPRGMAPTGWRAQEIVRVEAGVSGVGAEIDEETTPLEVGAMMQLSFNKLEFKGRTAVLHSTAREFARKMVSLRFEEAKPPEPGDPIEIDGVPMGYVTSAVYSPRSQTARALGFVDTVRSSRGTQVMVRGRERQMVGTVAD